jgi:hypothetical protein
MAAAKVDVIELIDRHPVTGFQIGVLILCMLVAALDGFDTQAIGYTAPAIAAVIHLPMPQFGIAGRRGRRAVIWAARRHFRPQMVHDHRRHSVRNFQLPDVAIDIAR